MSYAPNYTPVANFSQDESNNISGRSTIKNSKVDTEFTNISTSLNALNNNLKILQRSDGQLTNGIVTMGSLSLSVKAALGNNPDSAELLEQAVEDAESAATTATAQAVIATEKAVLTAADAEQTALDVIATALSEANAAASVTAAETARDAAFTNADVYADTAAGLAATTNGQQFAVVVGNDLVRYRNDSGTATEVARTPTSTVAGVMPQQQRIFEYPTRDKFTANEVQGAFSSDLIAVSNLVWAINGSGGIDVTANMSESFTRYFWTGFERKAGKPLRATARISFTDTSIACRAIIAIGTQGDATSLRQYLISQTGSMARQDGSSNTSGFSYLMTTFWTAIANNEIVELTLAVDENGNGYLYAKSDTSEVHCAVSGVPAGRVLVGARTASAWTVHSFNAAIEDVLIPVAQPFSAVLNDNNLLPTDLSKGQTLEVGAAVENVWRLNNSGHTIVNYGSYKGASITSNALRAYVLITPALHAKMSYHLRIETLLAASASASDRMVIIQQDAAFAEITRDNIYIAARDPSKPMQGVIDIDPATARIMFYIGCATGRTIAFSQASLVLSDTVGFRPKVEAQEVSQGAVVLNTYHILPDSEVGRTVKGFTSTGLDRITRGDYAGCWIVSDDGRIYESDGSPYDPKVHIITPDWRTILRTFEMPYTGASAQGIAVDTSGSFDTFWVATAGDKKLRHFDIYGVTGGQEITADVFDWNAAGYASNPNGLAYDADNDALYVTPIAGTELRLISCNPAASPRLLSTATLSTSLDQLHYDKDNMLLYGSEGGNGVNGNVYLHRVTTGENTLVYGSLQHAQAIEGIYIDRKTAKMTVVNDGGYHYQARPEFNIALEYSVPLVF